MQDFKGHVRQGRLCTLISLSRRRARCLRSSADMFWNSLGSASVSSKTSSIAPRRGPLSATDQEQRLSAAAGYRWPSGADRLQHTDTRRFYATLQCRYRIRATATSCLQHQGALSIHRAPCTEICKHELHLMLKLRPRVWVSIKLEVILAFEANNVAPPLLPHCMHGL